jgi:hypothetical protein
MTAMTMDSIPRLQRSLADVDDVLNEVALSAGDVPDPEDEPAIVEAVRDRVHDIRGTLAEAAAALRGGELAGTLGTCHEKFNEAARRVRSELTSAAIAVEIAAIAADRGGAWSKWSDAVQQGLDRCAHSTECVAAALLACWRELAAPHRSSAA